MLEADLVAAEDNTGHNSTVGAVGKGLNGSPMTNNDAGIRRDGVGDQGGGINNVGAVCNVRHTLAGSISVGSARIGAVR